MKTILLILVASFLPILANSQEKTDELFINWNKETVSSLKSIKETLTEQNYAKNRLEARFAYWEIKDESQLNRNSIRYTFLKILNKKIDSKDLVLIEADNSGEYHRIQNFVIYLNANNKLDLEVYRYNRNEGWKLEKTIANYDGEINSILENTGKDFINRDDVIVSHFELGKIVSSKYFLFETLKNNEIKRIISIE